MSAARSPLLLAKVSALKADLEAKSRAATAGWDAAAGAESEAAAAEARGLEAGIKRGHLDTEEKARGDSRSCAAATEYLRLRVVLRLGLRYCLSYGWHYRLGALRGEETGKITLYSCAPMFHTARVLGGKRCIHLALKYSTDHWLGTPPFRAPAAQNRS